MIQESSSLNNSNHAARNISLSDEQKKFINDACNCPIGREEMDYPVITSDGYSYQYNNILGWWHASDKSPMSNLPLVYKVNGNIRSIIFRKHHNLLLAIQSIKLFGQPINECFICPLTGKFFKEPVVLSDGYTYEKSAIEKWLKENDNTSPILKKPIDVDAIPTLIKDQKTIQLMEACRPLFKNKIYKEEEDHEKLIWNKFFFRILNGYDYFPIQSLLKLKKQGYFIDCCSMIADNYLAFEDIINIPSDYLISLFPCDETTVKFALKDKLITTQDIINHYRLQAGSLEERLQSGSCA